MSRFSSDMIVRDSEHTINPQQYHLEWRVRVYGTDRQTDRQSAMCNAAFKVDSRIKTLIGIIVTNDLLTDIIIKYAYSKPTNTTRTSPKNATKQIRVVQFSYQQTQNSSRVSGFQHRTRYCSGCSMSCVQNERTISGTGPTTVNRRSVKQLNQPTNQPTDVMCYNMDIELN